VIWGRTSKLLPEGENSLWVQHQLRFGGMGDGIGKRTSLTASYLLMLQSKRGKKLGKKHDYTMRFQLIRHSNLSRKGSAIGKKTGLKKEKNEKGGAQEEGGRRHAGE